MPKTESSSSHEWLEFEVKAGLKLRSFDCGNEELNSYLKRWARKHQQQGYANTFIVAPTKHPEIVAAYYSLAASQIIHTVLPTSLAGKLPRFPMPAIRLTRMATDLNYKGQRLGTMMIARAVARTEIAKENIGVRALLVDPKPEAIGFYKSLGFVTLTNGSMFLPVGWDN